MNFIVIKIVWDYNHLLPIAIIPPQTIAKKSDKQIRQWLEAKYSSKIKALYIDQHNLL